MVQSNTNPFNEQEQSTVSISVDEGGNYSYCSLPKVAPRDLSGIVDRNRANLILFLDKKWVNGTILHYYFFDQPTYWTTTETEKNVVRKAFDVWKQGSKWVLDWNSRKCTHQTKQKSGLASSAEMALGLILAEMFSILGGMSGQ